MYQYFFPRAAAVAIFQQMVDPVKWTTKPGVSLREPVQNLPGEDVRETATDLLMRANA